MLASGEQIDPGESVHGGREMRCKSCAKLQTDLPWKRVFGLLLCNRVRRVSRPAARGTKTGPPLRTQAGWRKGGALPRMRQVKRLLGLVMKAALWGAVSRLASWLMAKFLS